MSRHKCTCVLVHDKDFLSHIYLGVLYIFAGLQTYQTSESCHDKTLATNIHIYVSFALMV